MDTKDRNRPSSGGSASRRPAQSRSQNQTRRTSAGAKAANSGTGRRAAGTGSRQRRSTQPRREQPRRVVKGPAEEIPAVHYTMPKPFSRLGFLLKLASVAAAVAAVVMCLSLFFRVEEVYVSGAVKYTPWMVQEASGLEIGSSLLGVSDAKVSGNIKYNLPYVKEVRVGIQLPGTVYIDIVELETTYAIEARDGSWWLITAEGRVVESILTTEAAGYTRIIGVQADAPRVDQIVVAAEDAAASETQATEESQPDGVTLPVVVQTTNAQRLDAVKTILMCLEQNSVIGQIAQVDVSNLNDITMEYGQRLQIVLGTSENLAYKISYMATAVKQIEEYQTGILDVSFKYSEQALLNPEA